MAGLTVPQPKQPNIVQPGEAEDQLVRGYKQAGDEMEQRTAPLRQEMQSLETSITREQGTAPQPPKLDQVPKFQGREYDGNQALLVGNIALALGAIMGKTVRGDIGLALNTAGEAMKGFNTGNIEQARVERENFNTKMQSIIANNKTMLEEYDRVMKDRTLSMTEKMNRFRILSSRYKDEVGMAAAKKGDIKFELERLDKIRNANNQLEKQMAQMDQQWRMAQERMQNQIDMMRVRSGQNLTPGANAQNPALGWYTPQGLDVAAMQFMTTGKYPPLGNSAGAGRVKAGIESRSAEIGTALGLSAQEIALMPKSVGAQSKALDFMVKWQAGVTNSMGIVDKNFNVMIDYAKRVGLTEIQPINQMKLLIQTRMGDADSQAYETAAQTVMREYARVMSGPLSNAQLHVAALDSSHKIINSSLSFDQLTENRTVMKRDMENVSSQTGETIGGIKSNMMMLKGGLPKVASDKDYDALPFGQEYVDPEGKVRKKK